MGPHIKCIYQVNILIYKLPVLAGLQLVLNIHQAEYVKDYGDVVGAKLVIQHQNTMPFPEDDGITVRPDHASYVGVRKVVTALWCGRILFRESSSHSMKQLGFLYARMKNGTYLSCCMGGRKQDGFRYLHQEIFDISSPNLVHRSIGARRRQRSVDLHLIFNVTKVIQGGGKL